MIDTHCHLDQYTDSAAVLQRAASEQIDVVCMALSPADFLKNRTQFGLTPGIHVATGLIPQDIDQYADQTDRLIEQIGETRFIGEIGLDYVTENEDNRGRQRRLFERILHAAAPHSDRILSIHSRRAAPDVFAAIGTDFPGIAILHWYSGPIELVESAPPCVWFSINTAMITSRNGKKLVRAMPSDRILLESDGPYIQFSCRPAEPRDLNFTAERLAAIRGWSIADTIQRLRANWERAKAAHTPS